MVAIPSAAQHDFDQLRQRNIVIRAAHFKGMLSLNPYARKRGFFKVFKRIFKVWPAFKVTSPFAGQCPGLAVAIAKSGSVRR